MFCKLNAIFDTLKRTTRIDQARSVLCKLQYCRLLPLPHAVAPNPHGRIDQAMLSMISWLGSEREKKPT